MASVYDALKVRVDAEFEKFLPEIELEDFTEDLDAEYLYDFLPEFDLYNHIISVREIAINYDIEEMYKYYEEYLNKKLQNYVEEKVGFKFPPKPLDIDDA